MALPQEFLSELRARNDIVSVISGYVNLKRSGSNTKGLCPFHSEKTPSFTVFPDTDSFYCFGCQAGGDVITFIRMAEHLDYMEAVKWLAARAGMNMPEDGATDGLAKAKQRIREQNREAARFFYHELYTPGGRAALDYLHGRGLTDETIGAFGLGWSPDGWDRLSKHLLSLGYRDDEIISANLASRNRYGNLTDWFRARVMFPIIDLQGSVVGFGGRTMEKDHGGRKYINTNNTLIYKKSNNLYGLNFAKKSKSDTLIVVEGFMDVITLTQAGITNSVASQGTAFTAEQARLVSHYAKRVVLSQDGDSAGQEAIRRSIPTLKATGIDVRVLTIPEKLDPDEFINKYGVDRFRMLIERCASDIEYSISRIRDNYDITQDDGRLQFLRAVCPVLSELSPIEQEIYAGRLAEDLRVDKTAIMSQIQSGVKKKYYEQRRTQFKSLEAATSGREDKLNPERKDHLRAAKAEDELISLLLAHPDYIKSTAEKLKADQMVTSFNKRLYRIITEAAASGAEVTLTGLSQSLTPEEMSAAARLVNGRVVRQSDETELRGYIDAIIEESQKLTSSDITDKSTQELNEYLKLLKKKKI